MDRRPLVFAPAIAALLAGCSGTGSTPAAGMPGAPALAAAQHHARTWMAPEAAHQNLLYVGDEDAGVVYVFTYRVGRLVGTLTGFNNPTSVCADRSGHVWIPNSHESTLVKYAHGGTQVLATLKDPGYSPGDCAVDPKTGDLAVANNFTSEHYPPGNLVVYTKAKGKPKTYTDSNFNIVQFVTYDDAGNLFVDGLGNSSNNVVLAELPHGKSKLVDITLNQSIANGNGTAVQWDGKYLVLGDTSVNTLYQFTINGTHGTKQGETVLDGVSSGYLAHFTIPKMGNGKTNPQGNKIIVPNNVAVGFWNYPAGGTATKTLSDGSTFVFLSGAAVSKAR